MNNPTHANLGAFVKATRKHRRWTLRDMAARCHTSFSTISRVENGEEVTFTMLLEIAAAFNMAVGDMLVAAGYTSGADMQHVAAVALARQAMDIGFRELSKRSST